MVYRIKNRLMFEMQSIQNILDYIFTKLKCPTQFLNYVAVIHDNITNRKLYDISSEMIYCIIYTDIQQVRN